MRRAWEEREVGGGESRWVKEDRSLLGAFGLPPEVSKGAMGRRRVTSPRRALSASQDAGRRSKDWQEE